MTYENIIDLLGKLETFILNNRTLFLNEVSINIHLLNSKSYHGACYIKKAYTRCIFCNKFPIRDLALIIFYHKYKTNTTLVVENSIGNKINFYHLTKDGEGIRAKHKSDGWKKFKEFLMSK